LAGDPLSRAGDISRALALRGLGGLEELRVELVALEQFVEFGAVALG
jgi:hypothetical protein